MHIAIHFSLSTSLPLPLPSLAVSFTTSLLLGHIYLFLSTQNVRWSYSSSISTSLFRWGSLGSSHHSKVPNYFLGVLSLSSTRFTSVIWVKYLYKASLALGLWQEKMLLERYNNTPGTWNWNCVKNYFTVIMFYIYFPGNSNRYKNGSS